MCDDVTSFFFGQLILPNICSDVCKVLLHSNTAMHVQNVQNLRKKFDAAQKIACSEYMLQNSQFSIQPNLS